MVNTNCLTYEKCAQLLQTGRAKIDGCRAKKLENNTYLYHDGEAFHVRVHQTDVVSILPENTWVLRTGGWYTKLTSERINTYAPVQIWKHRGDWFYTIGGATFEFKNGVRISKEDIVEELI